MIDQFWDDLTVFGAIKFETNNAVFKILLISTNIG